MPQSKIPTPMSIGIPKRKQQQRAIQRLDNLSKKQHRSTNYLLAEAIMELLKKEERKR